MRYVCLTLAMCLFVQSAIGQDNKKTAFLDPTEAGDDFYIQGEYAGTIGDGANALKIGIQVIALGDGQFQSIGYIGGLPGDGWDGTDEKKVPGKGHMEGDVCILKADNSDNQGRGEIRDGSLSLFTADNVRIAEFPRVKRESPTMGAKAPEGAVVLFDGSSAENFEGGRMSEDKLLMEGATSRQKFQSYNLHLEFLLSFMPHARGQGRSNSGCYNQGRYEVQILDSFGLEGKNNECGGIYTISDPKVNMCFPPLSWQTYDIEYHAARFDDAGRKTEDAWMTVKHNGVVVQEKTRLDHATTASPLKEGPEPGPIFLQNHGNPVRFRNIWVQPID